MLKCSLRALANVYHNSIKSQNISLVLENAKPCGRLYAKLVRQAKDADISAKTENSTNVRTNNEVFSSFIQISNKNREKIMKNEQNIRESTNIRPQSTEGSERLTKYLARIGMCSRRQADDLISKGIVKINGDIAQLGARITPSDSVIVNGTEVNTAALQQSANTPKLYVFHKPTGMLCSRVESDPTKNRRTVHDVLKRMGMGHLIPIGRLDFNSEGLLLLTNDGALARYMMHPSTAMEREYLVRVHGHVTQEHLDKFKRGSNVMGERFGRVEAKIHREKPNCTWLRVSLFEGKNREIRKVFQHFGMFVSKLKRIRYGPYSLPAMQKTSLKQVKITDDLQKYCNDKFVAFENEDYDSL